MIWLPGPWRLCPNIDLWNSVTLRGSRHLSVPEHFKVETGVALRLGYTMQLFLTDAVSLEPLHFRLPGSQSNFIAHFSIEPDNRPISTQRILVRCDSHSGQKKGCLHKANSTASFNLLFLKAQNIHYYSLKCVICLSICICTCTSSFQ